MRHILVAGELNADLILSGLPSLPIPGRELIGSSFTMALGSSSAITAARLAVLGADDPAYAVAFTGMIGSDDIGRFVLEQLHHFGIHTDGVQIVDTPTGVTIALTYVHDRALLTYPGTIAVFDGRSITPKLLSSYTHLHVGSFFLQIGLQPKLAAIFQMAHKAGVTTSLDVGWDPAEQWMRNPYLAGVLSHTDIFLPNEDEAAALAESAEILKRAVSGTLIIKRGERGAAAYTDGRDDAVTVVHVPAFMIQPVDTTGAGDAFNAGFIYARQIRGETLESALRFAAACGAQATLQVGGATAALTEQLVWGQIAEWEQ